ncbi:hypothetical protein [Dubosiella newyorkensis]|jgi:hypothetical protein|uniref:hypothetical protein n=1 Tax=Dubosiella newyorkensis TaxID=1862672 RepID=UPI002356A291|nr:hypothetical protein [Dubosiella newyorkensis]MCI9040436.1 hypothetical protein [Dubosiella newyorkensis]
MNHSSSKLNKTLILLNEQSALSVNNGKVYLSVQPMRKKVWKDTLRKYDQDRVQKSYDL